MTGGAGDGGGDADGFLSRWSRRKRSAAAAQDPDAADGADTQTAAVAPTPGDDAPAAADPAPVEPPPPVERIEAGTDLAPWLRAGVPAATRNAALRRMWSVDPLIRDHRDLALDYAWDWNTPGGLPGGGGAMNPERVAESLRDLLDRPAAPPVAARAPEEGQGTRPDGQADTAAAEGPVPARPCAADAVAGAETGTGTGAAEAPRGAPAAAEDPAAPEAGHAATRVRRHGAARPV